MPINLRKHLTSAATSAVFIRTFTMSFRFDSLIQLLRMRTVLAFIYLEFLRSPAEPPASPRCSSGDTYSVDAWALKECCFAKELFKLFSSLPNFIYLNIFS